jgi:hypothetical protein
MLVPLKWGTDGRGLDPCYCPTPPHPIGGCFGAQPVHQWLCSSVLHDGFVGALAGRSGEDTSSATACLVQGHPMVHQPLSTSRQGAPPAGAVVCVVFRLRPVALHSGRLRCLVTLRRAAFAHVALSVTDTLYACLRRQLFTKKSFCPVKPSIRPALEESIGRKL